MRHNSTGKGRNMLRKANVNVYGLLLGWTVLFCMALLVYFGHESRMEERVRTTAPVEMPAVETISFVDLNTAAEEELETLPGIGQTLAKRIVAYREANGAFTAIEEIMEVSGIGESRFEQIKGLITVNGKGAQ